MDGKQDHGGEVALAQPRREVLLDTWVGGVVYDHVFEAAEAETEDIAVADAEQCGAAMLEEEFARAVIAAKRTTGGGADEEQAVL